MAPSTATPTDLHRAPIACLPCRKAKVRCLLSQRRDRCDRCIANDADCLFTQTKRTKVRSQPYPQRARRSAHDRRSVGESSTETLTTPSRRVWNDTHRPATSPRASPVTGIPRSQPNQPTITNEVRARIIAALATLKGKKGAPFSFVTSGDSPSFGASQGSQSAEQPQATPVSLKLSWLLRPLYTGALREDGEDRRLPGWVKMPTYLSSMTLGQTITDPVEGGMVNSQASRTLFDHFMVQMNAKWEYILDPHVDSHDNVQRRSSLLFTSILFCSSKFANYVDGHLVAGTDPYLQGRLCSLARNLVIRNLAQGDRSIETMQALYLLVCWKDPDDDVSYLHSGYAFGVLRDVDLESGDGDARQVARRRRTWLALFRQDRQQSLFFVRRAPLSHGDEAVSFLADPETWLKMPYALPCDFLACCSADSRRIQSRLRTLVQKASPAMLPCLLDLMDAELSTWRSKWKNHLQRRDGWHGDNARPMDLQLGHPGADHVATLVDLWEHSIRLNVASAILRQALLASVTSSLHTSHRQPATSAVDLDLSTIQQGLSPNLPGLSSSVTGAFETLRNLINFPPDDLRRAPDAVLLLAPNAALFLCLLLCLPPTGILGPAFQKTAVSLIRDTAQHIQQCVRCPQDTVTLHAAYLDSLVELLDPSAAQHAAEQQDPRLQPTCDPSQLQHVDDSTLQAAQVLADGIGGHDYSVPQTDPLLRFSADPSQTLHMQGLANLLDGDLFWDLLPGAEDAPIGL
ncbi:hypothetical protein P168DRAFT_310501 [Aspergillus campestris IBT 28561]|uniref:Zn(2)-C6 fungal-type domain-containing protein n=1 Tax=Aspergillus campestris (strain IBT 28561) TaxID=1392248 RepID=A0A2I1D5A1_ASPC2|nr:uncharacterized protein P168DRAFT_310501 [Aspergillus campestris IBT 28561]PKY05049.1 hypothetical protein P168DRAFT_310501 [Aspergillus campestris IBT 28561]